MKKSNVIFLVFCFVQVFILFENTLFGYIAFRNDDLKYVRAILLVTINFILVFFALYSMYVKKIIKSYRLALTTPWYLFYIFFIMGDAFYTFNLFSNKTYILFFAFSFIFLFLGFWLLFVKQRVAQFLGEV